MKKLISMLVSIILLISCGACAIEEEEDKKSKFEQSDNQSVYIENNSNLNDDNYINNNDANPSPVATRIEAVADGFIVPVNQKTEVPEGFIGIHNAQEFDSIRYNANANYILMNDIDLSEFDSWTTIEMLNGELDGNGYAIRGLNKINSHLHFDTGWGDTSNYALFYKSASIKNLAVISANIQPTTKNIIVDDIKHHIVRIGVISVKSDSLYNCYATGSITIENIDLDSSDMYVGGLCALISNTDNCYSSCNITIKEIENVTLYAGGLFGGRYYNQITNSYFDGKINVVKNRVAFIGGIIGGTSNYDITIKNCRSDAEINVTSTPGYTNGGSTERIYIGGIIGQSQNNIKNCYSNSIINASFDGDVYCYAGGIAGISSSRQTDLTQCYNTGDINVISDGEIYCGGIAGRFGGEPKGLNDNHYIIKDCFNTGSVTINSTNEICNAGGICGFISADIYNCYNTGKIVGNKAGAIAGDYNIEFTKLTNCYYTNTDIEALSVNAMFENVRRLSEAEAQNESSYTGFNFKTDNATDPVWTIKQNKTYNYPTLTNLYFEQ